MDKKTEALKLALEALEFYDKQGIGRTPGVKAITAIREALAEQPAPVAKPHEQQEPVSWERFMAVEKELQDMTAEFMRVANELAAIKTQQQDPVSIEYWSQDTMESGRWVTTDNMAKATAEKMLSGEYGDVYPQGRIVEPPPQPAQQQEPVEFLAKGTRFKMSFFENEADGAGNTGTYVTCFEAFEKELDGRWVALVAAEDDCHLKLTSPPASKPLADEEMRTEFESWVVHTFGMEFSQFEKSSDGTYLRGLVREYWGCWKAAHGITKGNT